MEQSSVTFKDLGLREPLLAAVERLGFEFPSPIQQKAIPILVEAPVDIVALAQTGTGKTAGFGLPLLHHLDENSRQLQALVLCPTRELCLQIQQDLVEFAHFMDGVNSVAVYGGSSIDNQIRQIKKGAQIIVATPGRLIDLIERKAVKLETIHTVVLDEADRMLDMGFKEDIDHILSFTTNREHTWLFSATMPNEVRAIASRFMDNPVEVTVGAKNATAQNITHVYYMVRAKDKYAALKRMVDVNPGIFGIIFTRTKIEAQEIADHLMKDHYNADALHGDLSQAQRDKVMARFRNRSLQLLVATDVAARGIDVDDVSHVINFGLPDDVENYTHRAGRTARAGKSGYSLSIVHTKEKGKIRELERLTKAKFEKGLLPDGEEVCRIQLLHFMQQVHDTQVDERSFGPFLESVNQHLEGLDREELIKRFAYLEFNRFLEYYKNAPDLNAGDERSSGSNEGRPSDGNMVRLFISLGEMEFPDRGAFFRFILDETGLQRGDVGRINLNKAFTHFDVTDAAVPTIMEVLDGATYNGRKIRVDRAEAPSNSGGRGGRDRGGEGRGRNDRGDRGDRGGYNRGGDRGGKPRSGGGGYKGGNRNSVGGKKKFYKD